MGKWSVDSAARDKLVVEAMKTGMSRESASILVDISKHAFEKTVEAAMRVLDTAPIELRKAGLASVAVLTEHFPDHWAAVKDNPTAITEPTVIVLPPTRQEQSS